MAIGAREPLPKQAMALKDYLLDDLSSCSSNGFQSYPRRQQCCTTVRFLLEIDLKPRVSDRAKRIPRTKSKSALQRASEAVVNAVKLLPFAIAKSAPDHQQSKPKRAILPRSFSRKLLNPSFWKKTGSEIQRWKSFRELIEEEEKSSADFSTTTTTTTTTTTLTTTSASNSWSDSDFTSDYSQCSTGNSENSCNDGAGDESRSPGKFVSVTVGEDSVAATNATKEWPEEEKEQLSPVSILDCPFNDDDDEDPEEGEEEEVSSPFKSRLARIQGSKEKLMQNIERFEKLAEIEPLDLEKHFSSSESPSPTTTTTQNQEEEEDEDDEDKEDRRAVELLEQLKSTMPSTCSFNFQDDDLLLDFFKQKITEFGHKLDEEEIYLNDAKDWMNGQPMEMYMDWVVPSNRQTYITDMEKGERWRLQKLDEEREELAMELEFEVFDSLLDDLLLDLF